jgi:hypothetical protein
MTIITALRNYIKAYDNLADNAPVWVNYLGETPIEYAIIPLAGERVIESYINGGAVMAYPFAFQSAESTADNLERLESVGFYEAFADWLDAQTEAGVFPTLDTGLTPIAIEALGWAYLYEQGESDTGVYQIQARLVYEKEA